MDVTLGEVKEGEAVFNPSFTRHETLHTVAAQARLDLSRALLDRYEDVLRSARFRSPSVDTLKPIHKAGFRLSRGSADAPDSP